MHALKLLLQRDLAIYWQNKHQCLEGMIFYVIACMLFNFYDNQNTAWVWVAALLATILSFASLFKHDYDSGTFAYLYLGGAPLPILIFAKTLVHWVTTQLPLILITPILINNLPTPEIISLLATLLIGTLSLSFIGAIGAALTVGLAQSGILLSILLLPLYVPVLILAYGCNYNIEHHLPYIGNLALLAALALTAILLAPFAASAAIKVNLQ